MSYEKLTKRDLMTRLLQPSREFGGAVDCRVVAHRLVENVLWTVVEASTHYGPYIFEGKTFEPGALYRFIRVHELKTTGRGRWSSTSWWESQHPRLYSCPLRYLVMTQEQCRTWRDAVLKEYRATARMKKLKAGDVVLSTKPDALPSSVRWKPIRYLVIGQSENVWVLEDIKTGRQRWLHGNLLKHDYVLET